MEADSPQITRLRNIAEISERCSLEQLSLKSDTYLLRIPGFGKGSLKILRGMFPESGWSPAPKQRNPSDLVEELERIASLLEQLADEIGRYVREKGGDNDAD